MAVPLTLLPVRGGGQFDNLPPPSGHLKIVLKPFELLNYKFVTFPIYEGYIFWGSEKNKVFHKLVFKSPVKILIKLPEVH